MSMHHIFKKTALNPHLEDSSSNLDFVPGIFHISGESGCKKGKGMVEA